MHPGVKDWNLSEGCRRIEASGGLSKTGDLKQGIPLRALREEIWVSSDGEIDLGGKSFGALLVLASGIELDSCHIWLFGSYPNFPVTEGDVCICETGGEM